jgi:hypothetical protein
MIYFSKKQWIRFLGCNVFPSFMLFMLILFFVLADSHSQDNSNQVKNCPVSGSAKDNAGKLLNTAKNRDISFDSTKINRKITINKILAHGNDTARFKGTELVSVLGYVVNVKYGGSESCNCFSTDKNEWDIHIEVAKSMIDHDTSRFVAEITPKFRKLHSNLKFKDLVGKKCRITGYLMFDSEHKGNAVNTCKKCTNTYRKTAWEIHPVSKIEIIK